MASIALDFRTNNGIIIEGTGIATSSTVAINGLQVGSAGVAIGKNLIVGSTATIWGNSTLHGTLSVDGVTTINNNTSAGAGALGSLVVNGGGYFANNLYINGTASSSVNTNTNSIYTQGGLGVAKDSSFGGSLVVTGNFTVLGTQTIINSTSTAIQDPVIDLGTNPNNSPLLANDGYNKGIVIHYYDTDDNHMFIGRNNLTGSLVLRHNIDPGYSGEIPNADYVNSGSFATFELGDLYSHGTNDSLGVASGAIQTTGGLGVTKAAYIGNTMTAATVYARDLTGTRLVFSAAGGQLVDSAALTWNSSAQRIEGTITYANTASNITGGSYGNLIYQTGTNQTGFIPNGSLGQILLFDGTKPIWSIPSGLSAGNATTATNIGAGLANQVPYQSAPGITSFSPNFTWNNGSSTLGATNAVIAGTTNSTSTTSGALVVAGGVGIAGNLWVGGNIYLDGVGLDTVQGTTATFTNVNVTGTGLTLVVTDSATIGNNLTVTNLVVTGSASIPGGITATNFTTTVLTVVGPTVLAQLSAALTTLTQLTVTGNAIVGGQFTVTQQTTLAGVTGTTASFATLHLTSTLTSTSTTTGALVVDGGVGIAKDLWVGGTANFAGINIGNTTVSANVISAGGASFTTATIADLTVTNTATITSLVVSRVTATDLTILGALVIGGSQFTATGGFTSTGTSNFTNLTAQVATLTNLTVGTETVGTITANTATVNGQLVANTVAITTTATIGGKLSVTDTTNSIAPNIGSITTLGGIGVAQDVSVGGAINIGHISTGTSVPAIYTNNVLLASYTSGSISGTGSQNLDTYSSTTYRTAKYFVQIVDGSSIHTTEITLFHDGSNVYKNEYAIATNAGELGSFDANLASNTITLTFTPTNATAMTIKVVRLGITA